MKTDIKEFRMHTLKKSLYVFTCIECKKTFLSKRMYCTKNLLYLCENCFSKLNKAIVKTNKPDKFKEVTNE